MINVWVRIYPTLGKEAEVRAFMTDWVKDAHAAGREQVGLSQHIFSATGPVLVITATHADVAELERRRHDPPAGEPG